MEHIKIFNSVAEKDNFIDADSFKYDIVGLVKNVEGVVYNPPEEIIHSYVVSNIRYIESVGFNSTANTITWDYTVDKTTRSGKRVNYNGTDSQQVTYAINNSINNVTISGQITKYEVNIPYSFTQESGQGSYLTFVPREDGTFRFGVGVTGNTIQYSIDNGVNWVTLENGVFTPTVHQGEKIIWKGELPAMGLIMGVGTFFSTCDFDVRGNALSLVYGDSFSNKTAIKDDGQFIYLFSGSSVVDSSGLVLPATSLKRDSYANMFIFCKKLEKCVMELPSSTVPYRAYQSMFNGCSSLKTGPLIKATSLGEQAMQGMFMNCTSLESIPSYSGTVTSIGSASCENMFRGCTSLTRGIDLTSANFGGGYGDNYDYMFSGCTSLNYIRCLISTPNTANTENWTVGVAENGTFVRRANVEWPRGTSGVPDGWTIVDDE